ncbi:4Fe-4S binding protein [Blastopirellula sp. JC732]|uniref:4Fe-4S binding protein n=1 Tax=Blastopirellula sediminis TaxID=2894196 RepID=A0A9X1MKV3_9BACT|nr:4Fe-4S binding protein [Blastopirellula sediminis]MCC9608639.1 4Fe-4S binding protein [Blastopirellula sediminis]MCC9628584.1 4Fe-4S binding protein [Blastopirellula sediminis]
MNENRIRWKSIAISVAFAALAIALTIVLTQADDSTRRRWASFLLDHPAFGWTIVGVLIAAAVIALTTSFDRRGGAILRIDWFLPMIRKQKTSVPSSPTLPGALLRKLIPTTWQSNWTTKQRGPIRRLLRAIGPSWLASPVRRVVQGICLVTFLVLFFYACWPYDARPKNTEPTSEAWRFVSFEQEQNRFEFESTVAAANSETVGRRVFVMREEAQPFATEKDRLLGEFVVAGVTSTAQNAIKLELSPADATTPAMMQLILGGGRDQTFAVHANDPTAWPSHYADNLASKERIPAELFLTIDPLVSLSTAIASRSWVWSLICAAAILIVCVLIPRGFCGYLCPLGTTIDLFDFAIAGRTKRFRVPDEGWWVHIKYYLLTGILVAAIFGVLVSGFFSAIPVITRAMLFLVDPVQSGFGRGWHLVPGFNVGHFLSIGLFLVVLCLGFLRPRFWCKYVCPSGAVFSIGNLFRVTERKVESSCINCNKCVEVCPFDAIKPDFTTRETDCTLCQTCAGVCPTHAIKFVERWNLVQLKVENDPPTGETAIGRRGFLSLAAGTAAAIVGGTAVAVGTKATGAGVGTPLPILPGSPTTFLPVRPPGSVPEQEFLQMCIRCGECFKACPNNVLQPESFQQGLEGLWTPMVNADWAGCESSCNACGQVCPTGAIRPLPLEEKRVARMGLAIVNQSTCLPLAGKEACDLCVQECIAAGYNAIEYTQVGVEVDDQGQPIEGTGFAAPIVLADKCVGCGLCQTRCNVINVKQRHVLSKSAIIVEAGEGKEDRLMSGSYLELRQQREAEESSREVTEENREPESTPKPAPAGDDPFGLDAPEPTPPTSPSAEESPF